MTKKWQVENGQKMVGCMVVAHGQKKCGLELHFSKFQLLAVNGNYTIRTLAGERIEATDSMTYLGATLYKDGSMKRELNRRFGAAWSDFKLLDRLWKHTSLETTGSVPLATLRRSLIVGPPIPSYGTTLNPGGRIAARPTLEELSERLCLAGWHLVERLEHGEIDGKAPQDKLPNP